MRRRHFLITIATSGLVALSVRNSTAIAESDYWDKKERWLNLRHVWTNEEITVTYWRNGHYKQNALISIDNILRDWRTGEIGNIFYQLLDHLFQISTAAKIQPEYDILSGFRSSSTNNWLAKKSENVSVNSLHTIGMAIDIRHRTMPTKVLFDVVKSLKLGGVGYYPRSDFIHIDVGPVRTWINN